MTKSIRAAVIVSGLAIAVAFMMMIRYQYIHWNAKIETAGDVGDFVGGLAAIIALVGTFAGFLLALGQVRETQEQQRTSEARQDRLEAKTELIAESMKVLAGNATLNNASLLTAYLPQLTVGTQIGDSPNRNQHAIRYTSGTISFQNDGERVEFTEARSLTEGLQARLLDAPVACDKGYKFAVHVATQGQLNQSGAFRLALIFTDKLDRSGWCEVKGSSFTGKVTVKNHMGQPE